MTRRPNAFTDPFPVAGRRCARGMILAFGPVSDLGVEVAGRRQDRFGGWAPRDPSLRILLRETKIRTVVSRFSRG